MGTKCSSRRKRRRKATRINASNGDENTEKQMAFLLTDPAPRFNEDRFTQEEDSSQWELQRELAKIESFHQEAFILERVNDLAQLVDAYVAVFKQGYNVAFEKPKGSEHMSWGNLLIEQYKRINHKDPAIFKNRNVLNRESAAYQYVLIMENFLGLNENEETITRYNPLLVPTLINILSKNPTKEKQGKSVYSRIQKGYLWALTEAIKNALHLEEGGLVIYPKPRSWVTANIQTKFELLSQSMVSAINELPHTIAEKNLLETSFYSMIDTYATHMAEKKGDSDWTLETLVDFGVGSRPEKTEIAIREALRWKNFHNKTGKLKVVVVDINEESAKKGKKYLEWKFNYSALEETASDAEIKDYIKKNGAQIEVEYKVSRFEDLPNIWNQIDLIRSTKRKEQIVCTYLGQTAFNGHTPEENLKFTGKLEIGMLITGVHGIPIDEEEESHIRRTYVNQYNSVGVYNLAQLLIRCFGKKVPKSFVTEKGELKLKINELQIVDAHEYFEGMVLDVYMPSNKNHNRIVPVYVPLWKIEKWIDEMDLLPKSEQLPIGVNYLVGGLGSIKPYVVPDNPKDERDQMEEIFSNCNLKIQKRFTNKEGFYDPRAKIGRRYRQGYPHEKHIPGMYLPRGAMNLIACYS